MLEHSAFRFHHIGLACRSLEVEAESWLRLGYGQEGAAFHDPIQKVRGLFMQGVGPRLELLEPADEGSPLAGYIARGVKLYHQGFEARNFTEALTQLADRGGKLTAPPAPAVAFAGRRVAFLMMPGMNLIEIIEASAG